MEIRTLGISSYGIFAIPRAQKIEHSIPQPWHCYFQLPCGMSPSLLIKLETQRSSYILLHDGSGGNPAGPFPTHTLLVLFNSLF